MQLNAGSALSAVIYGFIYLFLITIQIPYRLFVSSFASPLFQIEISSTVEATVLLSALISMHLPRNKMHKCTNYMMLMSINLKSETHLSDINVDNHRDGA